MNPVKCHTGDIQKLALGGTDYKRWNEVDKAFLQLRRVPQLKETLEERSSGTLSSQRMGDGNTDNPCGHGTRQVPHSSTSYLDSFGVANVFVIPNKNSTMNSSGKWKDTLKEFVTNTMHYLE